MLTSVSTRIPRQRNMNSAVVLDSVQVFEQLFAEGVSLCVWNRPPDAGLVSFLRRCLGQSFASTQKCRIGQDIHGYVPPQLRTREDWQLLATELGGLVDLFSTLADTDTVGIRLLLTSTQPCPRFHSDRVSLRMICTWAGPGTEWLEKRDLVSNRTAAGLPPDQSVAPGAVIHEMQPFAIGVFKGELWPSGTSVLHRSPVVAADGWRAMVSIDAL